MLSLLVLFIAGSTMAHIPDSFISLSELCPDMKIQASYAGVENFTGEIVPGYKAKKAFMAKVPAEALCRAYLAAKKRGLGIKIFDGYRPTKAVAFFQEWAKRPETNPRLKEFYYPKYTRLELFELGYIAKQSSHSRGSAVDLTLYDLSTGKDLDMGSAFDYFDDLSHTESSRITEKQKNNRQLLKELMEGEGFKNFSQEWWHYSFRPEPFPDQSFNFDVE